MVSEAILGTILGGGFALLGSYLNGYFSRKNTKDRIQSQNKRKRAEFLLEKEAEILFALLQQTHNADKTIRETDAGRMRPESEEVAQQFRQTIEMFETAEPFISDRVSDASHEMVDFYSDFYIDIKNGDWDWDKFDPNKYDEAHRNLLRGIQEEINRPVQEFDEAP